MRKNIMLELVMSYKKSSAIITAYETGIFEKLHKNLFDIQTLSHEIDMNPAHLSLFLLFLDSMNLVKEENGKWSLTEDFESSYEKLQSLDDVIHHERKIFQRWMYPERLEQSLKVKMGEREFDQIGFSEEETKLYDQTMYGSNLRLLGLRINREIRAFKNPAVLEYGRSKDTVLQALKKTGYQFTGYCMSDKSVMIKCYSDWTSDFEILVDDSVQHKFDTIILYNIVHYYDQKTFQDRVDKLEALLNENGLILIIDLFYQKENLFSANILPDWLTHGGTNFHTIESVEKELVQKDFQTVHITNIKDINSMILVIERA